MLNIYPRWRGLFLPISLWLFSLILVSVQSYQAERATASPFARAVSTLISYPERSYSYTRRGLKALWGRYIYLSGVEQKNLALQKQIASLLIENQRMQAQARENERLKSLLGFKESLSKDSLPARIIGWDLSVYARMVTINVGLKDGAGKGQAVISVQGLVGQIINEPGRPSGQRFANVLLITDPTSRVSVVIERTRDRGIVEGTGREDQLLLKYLSPEAKPLRGDTVLTSGLGGIFPAGIQVGTIEKIEQNPFSGSLQCFVKPSVDFSHLEEVLVLTGKENDAQR